MLTQITTVTSPTLSQTTAPITTGGKVAHAPKEGFPDHLRRIPIAHALAILQKVIAPADPGENYVASNGITLIVNFGSYTLEEMRCKIRMNDQFKREIIAGRKCMMRAKISEIFSAHQELLNVAVSTETRQLFRRAFDTTMDKVQENTELLFVLYRSHPFNHGHLQFESSEIAFFMDSVKKFAPNSVELLDSMHNKEQGRITDDTPEETLQEILVKLYNTKKAIDQNKMVSRHLKNNIGEMILSALIYSMLTDSTQSVEAEIIVREPRATTDDTFAEAERQKIIAELLAEEPPKKGKSRGNKPHSSPAKASSSSSPQSLLETPSPKRAVLPITPIKGIIPSSGRMHHVSYPQPRAPLPYTPIYRRAAHYEVTMHPRVERWNTENLSDIKRFTDKNDVQVEIKRYCKMSDKQLIEQKLRHWIPGFVHLLQIDDFRSRYMFSTPQGNLLNATIESPWFTELGSLFSVGLGEDNTLFHLFLHKRDELISENGSIDHLFERISTPPLPCAAAASVRSVLDGVRFEEHPYPGNSHPTLHLFYSYAGQEIKLTIYPIPKREK